MTARKASWVDGPELDARGDGRRVALVAARFNADVTDVLLARARETLLERGVAEDRLEVYRVPGAWELPQAARRAAATGRFHAVVALGCVIRGETPHFDYICEETARGLGAAARDTDTPVVFGVLTTETPEQAEARADPDRGDKGREAALAALEMAALWERLG